MLTTTKPFVWLEGVEKWEDKNGEGMKKYRNIRYFSFPLVCLVGEVEK